MFVSLFVYCRLHSRCIFLFSDYILHVILYFPTFCLLCCCIFWLFLHPIWIFLHEDLDQVCWTYTSLWILFWPMLPPKILFVGRAGQKNAFKTMFHSNNKKIKNYFCTFFFICFPFSIYFLVKIIYVTKYLLNFSLKFHPSRAWLGCCLCRVE